MIRARGWPVPRPNRERASHLRSRVRICNSRCPTPVPGPGDVRNREGLLHGSKILRQGQGFGVVAACMVAGVITQSTLAATLCPCSPNWRDDGDFRVRWALLGSTGPFECKRLLRPILVAARRDIDDHLYPPVPGTVELTCWSGKIGEPAVHTRTARGYARAARGVVGANRGLRMRSGQEMRSELASDGRPGPGFPSGLPLSA